MSHHPKGIAFFDMDGTITHKDTFLAFIRYTEGNLGFFIGLLILSPFILAYFMGFYSNHKLKKRFFTYFYKGISVSELQQKGDDFALKVLPLLCRKGALTLLEQHQERGHLIYIITASSNIWLAAWCAQEGYHLTATQFAEKDGQYTGNFEGLNCYGKAKRSFVQAIIDKHPHTIIFAYGDTEADQHFLALAQFAYCISLSMENVKKHELLGF